MRVREIDCPSCQCAASRRALPFYPNQSDHSRIPYPIRGALRDRHGRWERDAMDAISQRTNDDVADGEVVWSWRPDAGAKLAMMLRITPTTVARKPGSPERARRKPLKPLRREGRVLSAEPVVRTACFFIARGPWVRSAPGLPCALVNRRGPRLQAPLGRNASRDC